MGAWIMDPGLRDYCTSERQREFFDAVVTHGNYRAAEMALGVSRDLIGRAMRELAGRAARQGYAPGHFKSGTAPGFAMGKVTIQRNALGGVERTWERQHPDAEKAQEAFLASIEAMRGEIVPAPLMQAPTHALAHLLTLYSFFDYHVGMLAWHKEGGADWDLQIAERTGVAAMQMLVDGAPASDTAVINIGGDFLHFDGLLPVTPTSGHVLDADSRFGKVVEVAIRLIRQLVGLALQKHRYVTLLIMEGNHDLSSSLWLRKLFSCLYENEPRVTVHESELPYYAIEWGVCMLGFHHGHIKKNDSLPQLFASLFREMWGRCRKVYIHTGHLHHLDSKDHTGARVTRHPTLAAMDAHSARGGYFTEREITAVTYSRMTGQAGTNSVSPEMLEAAA